MTTKKQEFEEILNDLNKSFATLSKVTAKAMRDFSTELQNHQTQLDDSQPIPESPTPSEGRWLSQFDAVTNLLKTVDAGRQQNWEKYGRLILGACDQSYKGYTIDEPKYVAYILATTSHESLFAPIREYTFDKPWTPEAIAYFTKYYEGRSDLGNTQTGDGAKFAGRGFVQLTGRRNYTLFTEILNEHGYEVDLVNNPDQVLDPAIAVFVMIYGMLYGSFTGAKLMDYLHSGKSDFLNARRIINSTDKASLIAGYARSYRGVLR